MAMQTSKGAVYKGPVYKGPKAQLNPMMKSKKKMTQAQDDAYDRKHGIKEGSKRDQIQDAKNGILEKKAKKHKAAAIKTTGKFNGKPNKLGGGGRFAQLEAQGKSPALAAFIGRRKYGNQKMAQLSAGGKKSKK